MESDNKNRNEIETQKEKQKEKIRREKMLVIQKINRIDKLLANWTIRRGKPEIIKIKDDREDITINTKEIQIINEYIENLYSNKLETLEDVDKFIDVFDQAKLSQEDINHLNVYKKK
jgi:hypothetical protein